MENKEICKTGEKPGEGAYICTNCEERVDLGEHDKMPPCPSCGNNEFIKK